MEENTAQIQCSPDINTDERKPKKRSRCLLWTVLTVLTVLVAMSAYLALKDARVLLSIEKEIKQDIKTIAHCVIENDSASAAETTEKLDSELSEALFILNKPLWRMAHSVPYAGHDVKEVRELLTAAQGASDDILKPSLEMLRQYRTGTESIRSLCSQIDLVMSFTAAGQEITEKASDFVSCIADLPKFNIGRLEKKVSDIREYAEIVRSLMPLAEEKLLPAAVDACENVLSPIRDKADGIELPEGFLQGVEGLKTLDDQTVNVYSELLLKLLPYVNSAMSDVHTYISEYMADIEKAFPDAAEQVKTLKMLIETLQPVTENCIGDVIRLYSEYPLSKILPGGASFNVVGVVKYIELAEKVMPPIRKMSDELSAIDTDREHGLGKVIVKIEDKVNGFISTYDTVEKYIPLIKLFLNSGEDSVYLLGAQNAAEIRASGGFPGLMGVMRIKDGILSIDEFASVYSVITGYLPAPYSERTIFTSRINLCHDAGFNPYFPRVAEAWSAGYRNRTGTAPDGVISISPILIQPILAIAGPVTLSNGMELNGTNAVNVLQHGLYKKYFSRYNRSDWQLADTLFAESAKLSIENLFSSLSLSGLPDYLALFESCIADRTVMLWMPDEEAEKIIESYGVDGGFNKDPAAPELGIYFSNFVSSKLGWYLKTDIVQGEGTKNGDGSWSYDMSVTFTNTLDCRTASNSLCNYIFGGEVGDFIGSVYFVAPAGGTISNATYGTREHLASAEYMGSSIAYLNRFRISTDDSVSFRFTVTTAPCDQSLMTVVTTPLLQEYWDDVPEEFWDA